MTEKVLCDNCTDKEHCPEYKAGAVCANDRNERKDEKMSKNELKAIQAALRCADETIQLLGTGNYPYSDFEDKDIREMHYSLNTMILKLYDKIEAANGQMTV